MVYTHPFLASNTLALIDSTPPKSGFLSEQMATPTLSIIILRRTWRFWRRYTLHFQRQVVPTVTTEADFSQERQRGAGTQGTEHWAMWIMGSWQNFQQIL